MHVLLSTMGLHGRSLKSSSFVFHPPTGLSVAITLLNTYSKLVCHQNREFDYRGVKMKKVYMVLIMFTCTVLYISNTHGRNQCTFKIRATPYPEDVGISVAHLPRLCLSRVDIVAVDAVLPRVAVFVPFCLLLIVAPIC